MFARSVSFALSSLAALLVSAGTLAAQTSAQPDGNDLHATRASLESMLANPTDASQAALIRTRLERGDFQSGDPITLIVEGHENLTNTFTVSPGPMLVLPAMDAIPLNGVLRSELQNHLTEQLGRYVVDPRVHAHATIRIVVEGGVSNPGFYDVPSTSLVTDALAMAGNTSGESQLRKIRVERGDSEILGGEAMYASIIAGQSLDQMNLRAGDRLIVPSSTNWRTVRNVIGVVGGVASLAFLFGGIF